MSPKKLLRLKDACSELSMMGEGLKFKRVIPERDIEFVSAPSNVKRLVLCSGQVYYDLKNARQKDEQRDVAVVTIEQLFPFPSDHVSRIIDEYKNAEVVWVQEEHKNAGAWNFVEPRLNTVSDIF